MDYDLKDLTVTFYIGDFPSDVSIALQSCLDINGFVSNEPKFREIAAANISKLVNDNARPLKLIRKLETIIKGGKMLNLERDAEKPQFGLNFALNKYEFSLDPVPGKPDLQKVGTKVLSVIGIAKNNEFYLTAYEDEDGNYRYAGRIKPFLVREKLFVEPVEETADVLWIDPKKFKNVKVKHGSFQYSMQDVFSFGNKMTKVGSKLSAIASDQEFVELTEESASIEQLTTSPIQDEAKMPSLKEIQHVDTLRTQKRLRNVKQAMSREQCVDVIRDVDQRVTSWRNKDWTKLFNELVNELVSQGKIYSPSDKETLRQEVINKLQAKGSDTTSAETSLIKLLNTPLEGISISSVFLDSLISKTNAKIYLGSLVEDQLQPLEKEASATGQCAWCNADLDNDIGICSPICEEAEEAGFTSEMFKVSSKLVYSAEYEWSYSPMKGGTYGRLSWLVPAILGQTRLKDDKWDPSPLSGGDLSILKQLVKKGKRSARELQRETNYYNEWHSGKWDDAAKENIRNEVLERVTGGYQEANNGKLPPFLKDPFKKGDRVLAVDGPRRGTEGIVQKVNPQFESAVVRFNFFELFQDVAIPFKHLKLLPPLEKAPPPPKPEEEKRPYVAVKDELDKLLGTFQPGNWLALLHGMSPKGTKAEQLMYFYKERAQLQRPFPTAQEIMDRLSISYTAVSQLARIVLERAQIASTPEGARTLMPPKKSALGSSELTAGFMPSVGTQPFWGQHGDGDHGDYPYPMNTLYPKISPEDADGGGQDASQAYTHVWDKINPKRLLNILKKMPVSKEDAETDSQEIHKYAHMDVDPYIEQYFDIPSLTIKIDQPADISGTYRADKVKSVPSGSKRFHDDSKPLAPYIKQNPFEKMKKEKQIVGPLPDEGEKAPLHLVPFVTQRPEGKFQGTHEFKSAAEILYKVTYVRGDNSTSGTVIGYFDASEFLAHTSKKDNASKDLTEWLKGKIEEKAASISKLLKRTRPESETPEKLSWQTAILQSAISEDWDQAFKDLQSSGAPEKYPEVHKALVVGLLKKLVRQNKFKELLDAIAKYRLLPPGWTLENKEQLKKQVETLSGKGIGKRPAGTETKSDYEEKANLILDGNEMFPTGGSVEAKEKVLRDADPDRIKEFVLSKNFTKQSYGVQIVAVERLEVKGDIKGLFAVWENKELPSSLRMIALQALAIVHGVGSGYTPEGKFKALLQEPAEGQRGKKGILTEAAEDPDPHIRGLAYSLMADPQIDVMPWNDKGELAYGKNRENSKKNQPTNDIPSWLITQISNEPYRENREIIYKIIKELPKELVKEDVPPVLDKDLKITTAGKYSFSEELRPNLVLLLLAALNDKDPHVRAQIRHHFGLPKEIELLPKEQEKGEKEFKMVSPSAKAYLFHAVRALDKNDYEDAEKQLALATHARDADEYKNEIDQVKERVVRQRNLGKEGLEAEERISKLQEALMTKHPDLREIVVLTAFLDWESSREHQKEFSALDVKEKEKLISDAIKNDNAYTKWLETLPPEKPEGQRRNREDRRKNLQRREEDINDEPFEKKGAPLSAIELESRQPPTTWPLQNPQVGYGSAVPLGSQDNRGTDDLMLKDVRMYFGRPEGKWRSLLNQVYKMLFDDKNIDEEENLGEHKQMLHKTAAEAPKTREEALEFINKGDLPEVHAAVDYFAANKDEEGLLAGVNAFRSPKEVGQKEALRKIINAAREASLPKVLEAAFNLPTTGSGKDDFHEDAVKAMVALKDVAGLNKVLYTEWHPWAVKGLLNEGYEDQLKEVYRSTKRPTLQRTIVLELGEQGDPEFMKEALDNPNEEIKLQAVEWLTFHKNFDILKEYSKKEKDPKAKAAIDKALAMNDQGSVAPVFDKFDPAEQSRKIDQLVDIAQRAFTRWNNYPDMRQKVLGKFGDRYPITSFGSGPTSWLAVQPKIDAEIHEMMQEEPSFAQGQEAIKELEEIVKKIPDLTKRTKALEIWLEEARQRYNENKGRADEKSLAEFKEKINKAEKNLELAQLAAKGDLEFKVSQLQLLERDAKWRESLAEAIKHDDAFKKEYGSLPGTLKDYQAYVKTYDQDFKPSKSEAKLDAEGLNSLEKKQEEIAWKYTEPLRQRFEAEKTAAEEAAKKLVPYYRSVDINVDSQGVPHAPGIKELNRKIRDYKSLENQWYKLSGAVLPYALIEGERYYIPEPMWVAPDDKDVMPEYARGKRLVKPPVGRLRSPWTQLLEGARKEKVELNNDFLKSLNEKLPPEGKDLLLSRINHEKKAAAIANVLSAANIGFTEEGKLVYDDPNKGLRKSKDEYKSKEKELLARMKSMTALKESKDPKDREEYIRLRKDLHDFQQAYGFNPMPDTPEANLKKQYLQDRWKNPIIRGPQTVPVIMPPEGETKGPYSGGRDYTDAERKNIENIIERRRQEYGPIDEEHN